MATMAPTIFIADDDAALLNGLHLALKGKGYAVRTASSGAALLSLLELERPDLLLLDVIMPGMTGVEVLTRIRRDGRWTDLPVVVVTAVPDAAVHAVVDRDEAADVMPKPFRLHELLARIEGWVGRGVV
jgi:two-component system sensor histidine kinase ChiS